MRTQKKKGTQGPEFMQWFAPLLQALRELGGSATSQEAIDKVAEICKVPASQREVMLKSGAEKFANQVRWARQYLMWAGLLTSGGRGIWALTPLGEQTTLTNEQALKISQKKSQLPRKPISRSDSEGGGAGGNIVEDSPQDDEDAGLARFLEVIGTVSPAGFERMCLRLLREAGFEQLEVTGRANDGGVDGVGVLKVNDLVSFNVIFQSKKWVNSVPPKEIRDLRGAMAGRAEKAIFLTTGTFTVEARKEAIRPGAAPIELVDGEKLYAMFQRYGLGLIPRTVYDIDNAFFDAFR